MKRLLVIIGAILLLVLGIGVSYSMWIMTNSQDNMNAIETTNKCFNVELTSESDNIKLENAYPISDDAGSKLSPYSFKITNTCEWNAYYKVNLETLNKSTINNKFIKASINNSNAQVINMYKESDTSLKDGKIANTLKSGYLPVGGSVSFNLRLWMDYETTIDDIKNDGTDKWIGKIVVVSNLVEDEEILAACKSHDGDLIDDGECRKYYVKLNNIVNNGIFENKGENWKFLNSNFISYTKDTSFLSFECRALPCGPYQGVLDKAIKNNIYYVSQNVKVKNLNSEFYLGIENVYRPSAVIKNYDWNKYSQIIDYNDSLENFINQVETKSFVIYIYDDESKGFYIRNLVFTNLTLMFGPNNEPNKEWCDEYLDRYVEYNLEGIMTPIKEVGNPIKTAYYDVISLID